VRTLARVQRGLETLYRVETGVTVDDFVIDEPMRESLAPQRKPREQLLVAEADGEMSLALFVDPAALANLAAHDPSSRLGDHNLGDFLLAVEGVSHFIYAIWCAQAERRVSQLELELQAEVDKYVTCLLTTEAGQSATLRHRLFVDAEYEPDLDAEERDRYRAANDNAARYAAYLEATYVAPGRIPEMLGELRRFYRHGLAAKLAVIARAA
jgi:protein required for attachment to host cells